MTRTPVCVLVLLAALGLAPCAAIPSAAAERAPATADFSAAAAILEDLAPSVPDWVWDRLDCLSVVELGRGGFIVGGTHGRGFLTCRKDQEANERLYGRKVTLQDLLVDRTVDPPEIAQALLDAVTAEVARNRDSTAE